MVVLSIIIRNARLAHISFSPRVINGALYLFWKYNYLSLDLKLDFQWYVVSFDTVYFFILFIFNIHVCQILI